MAKVSVDSEHVYFLSGIFIILFLLNFVPEDDPNGSKYIVKNELLIVASCYLKLPDNVGHNQQSRNTIFPNQIPIIQRFKVSNNLKLAQ